MPLLKCCCGKDIEVDDYVYDLLKDFKFSCSEFGRAVSHKIGKVCYQVISIPISSYVLPPKPGFIVDHIDRNPHNNLVNNLRYATPSQNAHNKSIPKNNTSGYKGVSFYKYRKNKTQWRAQICVNNKPKHLGYFETAKDAAVAYNTAAEKYHQEFAVLNKIHDTVNTHNMT